jgi:hypothetical protein
MNQNVYFEVCRQVESYNYIIFVFKNGSIYLLELPFVSLFLYYIIMHCSIVPA